MFFLLSPIRLPKPVTILSFQLQFNSFGTCIIALRVLGVVSPVQFAYKPLRCRDLIRSAHFLWQSKCKRPSCPLSPWKMPNEVFFFLFPELCHLHFLLARPHLSLFTWVTCLLGVFSSTCLLEPSSSTIVLDIHFTLYPIEWMRQNGVLTSYGNCIIDLRVGSPVQIHCRPFKYRARKIWQTHRLLWI